jgi:hypothetical protein
VATGPKAEWCSPFVLSLSKDERDSEPPFDKLRANGD